MKEVGMFIYSIEDIASLLCLVAVLIVFVYHMTH